MFTLTKWIAAPALALGLMFVGDSPQAQAQYGYGCYGYGGGYGGISIGIGRYGSYRAPLHGYGYGSHFGHHRSWYHDTTHLHYHPTEIRRHGNHYHIQPGHYDVHRTGHWHH